MKPTLFRRAARVALLAALTLAPCGAALGADAVPPQFPIRDFFSNPERAWFRLSEDGGTLSFMQPVDVGDGKRRLNVFVQELDGSKPVGDARKLTS